MEVRVTKHSTQQGLYILDLDPCIHSYIPHGGLIATDLKVALSHAERSELVCYSWCSQLFSPAEKHLK